MADLSTEQLQAALDRLSESFAGLGSRMDAQTDALTDSEDTQRKADKQLSKFGLNIEERNKQLRKEIDIQEDLEKQLKDNVAGYASMTKAQQEELKTKKLQETATKDILKQLKDQNESIQGLTREQNAAIETQQKLNRRKQEEADSTKHAGDKVTNTFNQMSSASGILSTAQKAATERFGGTAAAAASINLAFTGLQMGLSVVTLKFDQYIQSIDQAFQNQMAYNNAVALGADGMKKANMTAIAQMKQDAARNRQNFDQNLGFAKQLGITAAGVGALGVYAATTGRVIMGMTGPIGIFVGVLTAIGAWWFGKKAVEEKQLEQSNEAAAQRLEQQSQLQDMLTKNFNDLGKASMTGVRGMTGLTEASHRAGFAIKDMDKFAGIIKSTQKDMSLFGLTAVQGVDKFAEVTGNMTNKFGMYFRNLGMDQEEQAAATEKYMALQARLGLLQNKTQDQLTAGAGRYIDELDKTAQMLGQSRKEQEDARAAIEGIEQLQAAMMDASERGDTSRKEELQRAINAASAVQKMDPKVAAGIAKLVASRGAVSDEDTQKALQSVPQTLEAVRKGTGSDLTREFGATSELVKTLKRNAAGFAATGVDTGMTSGGYKAGNEQAIRNAKIQKEATERALKEGIKEGTPAYEKMFKEIFDRAAKDPQTNKVNQELIKQQQASIASDKDLLSGMSTFNTASTKFDQAVDKFSGTAVRSGAATDKAAAAVNLQSNMTRSNGTTYNPYVQNRPGGGAISAPAASFSTPGGAHAGQGGFTPASAPAASFRVAGGAHAGQGGFTPPSAAASAAGSNWGAMSGAGGVGKPVAVEHGGSGRGGQGGADATKAIAAAIPNSPPPPQDSKTTSGSKPTAVSASGSSSTGPDSKGPPNGKFKNKEEFVKIMYPWAQYASAKLGAPAMGILGQWAAESGVGTSLPAEYNYAGIKAGSKFQKGDFVLTEERYNKAQLERAMRSGEDLAGVLGPTDTIKKKGRNVTIDQWYGAGAYQSAKDKGQDWVQVKSYFAKFGDLKDFSDSYVSFLKNPRYAEAMKTNTAEDFGRAVASAGYATAGADKYGAHVGDFAKNANVSAAKGGIVDGPKSGFPATLHGNEIIAPLSPNSILEQLGKTSVEEMKSIGSNESSMAYQAVMDMLSTKLDDVIDRLERGNTYSDKLVKAMA